MYKNHSRCRACNYGPKLGAEGIKAGPDTQQLVPVFDLGIQPLANDFVGPTEDHSGYAPLKVLCCPRCGLGQLSVVVNPSVLYSHYLYVTSQSDTMRQHFDALYTTLSEQGPLGSLLEIGSNDGALLRHFADKWVKGLGIDPAENLAEEACNRKVPTIVDNFNRDSSHRANSIRPEGFDVILARHVFCHVDNWKEFVDCLAIPSHKDTIVAIEVPYAKDLLDRGEFDTIYHEHLSYLTIRSVVALLKDSPFNLYRIVRYPIHGGAILLMLTRKDSGLYREPHPSVATMLAEENITPESWEPFTTKAHTNINVLKDFVAAQRHAGKRVVGFGASAKSTVFVNACKFTRRDIAFITDTTQGKLWKLSPGTDIPIVDEGAILRELPDYAICFAWNFREFILKNNETARSHGVKFVFPIPSLEIV